MEAKVPRIESESGERGEIPNEGVLGYSKTSTDGYG